MPSGQIESTLLNSFLKASKLKRWLARTDCPRVFQEIWELFERVYAPKTHDSDEDMRDNSEVSTPTRNAPDDLKCLLGRNCEKVSMRARLRRNGVMYSINSTHAGNSQIYFYPNGDSTASPVTASIQHIFNTGDGTRLAVYCAQTLPDHIPDPFARYPHFPAKLYSSYIKTTLEEVDPAWIYCHYARWVVDDDYTVILKLTRVSSFLIFVKVSVANCSGYRSRHCECIVMYLSFN